MADSMTQRPALVTVKHNMTSHHALAAVGFFSVVVVVLLYGVLLTLQTNNSTFRSLHLRLTEYTVPEVIFFGQIQLCKVLVRSDVLKQREGASSQLSRSLKPRLVFWFSF